MKVFFGPNLLFGSCSATARLHVLRAAQTARTARVYIRPQGERATGGPRQDGQPQEARRHVSQAPRLVASSQWGKEVASLARFTPVQLYRPSMSAAGARQFSTQGFPPIIAEIWE